MDFFSDSTDTKHLNFKLRWEGSGINEVGIDQNTNKVIIKINPRFFRPAEVDLLIGDNTKARKILGWEPKIKFKELVKIMVESDLKKLKNHELIY